MDSRGIADMLTALRSTGWEYAPAACRQAVEALVEGLPGSALASMAPALAVREIQRAAVGVLARCAGPWPDGLAEPVGALVAAASLVGGPWPGSATTVVLAAAAAPPLREALEAGARDAVAGHPAADLELSAVLELAGPARALVAELDPDPGPPRFEPVPDLLDRVGDLDAYAEGARLVLEYADRRADDVQQGRIPYAADAAFSVVEGRSLHRAALVALARDEPWVGPLLERLLPAVSVAPTAARTLPSQSASAALATAVERVPTPEAVAVLKAARAGVRHAGMAKKLDRLARAAEKGLARRPPDIALRLPVDAPPTRARLAAALRALEGGLALGTEFDPPQWRRLADHPHLGPVIRRLVWEFPAPDGGRRAALPADVPDADGPVRLWHPVTATAQDRAGWRDRIMAERLEQPFKQVFREVYGPDAAGFAGLQVSLRPLLGLATREGWRPDHRDCALRRGFGSWRVRLDLLGGVHPGAEGATEIKGVAVESRVAASWLPAPLPAVPPHVLSEALRAVDLLVSVAAVAEGPAPVGDGLRADQLRHLATRPPSEVARTRRDVLQRIVHDLPGGEPLRWAARHVHVGPYAVHLSTGRVTRDGDPVEIDLPPRSSSPPLPWLPYDERLLERIVHTVVVLAYR